MLIHRACLILFLFFSAELSAADINVDSILDESDSSCMDGDCSLRDAIALASDADRVIVPTGTYLLTLGVLEPSVDLEIIGAGAQQTIIDAQGNSNVFEINGIFDITLADMTITSGVSGRGGGVHSIGANLTLQNCIVSDSSAFNGGGVVGDGGTLLIDRCAIIDNLADGNSGAGVLASGASLTIINSTISGNQAPAMGRVGGGVAVFGELPRSPEMAGTDETQGSPPIQNVSIRNTTITNNSAEAEGGGIFVSSGGGSFVSVSNSIIANNVSGMDCSEAILSDGYNLDSDGSCGLTGVGDLSGINPLLDAIGLNSGTTPNFLPQAGSPVINAGNPAAVDSSDQACVGIDQRGILRPQDSRCEIGSIEVEGVGPGPGDLPPVTEVPALNRFGLLLMIACMLLLGFYGSRRMLK